MTEQPGDKTWSVSNRGVQIFLAVGIALAFIGFFVGTRHTPHDDQGLSRWTPAERPTHEAMPARAYTDILDEPLAQNEQWVDDLDALAAKTRPDPFAEISPTPEDKHQALAERAERRAYDGAPPVVPHAVTQKGDLACVACHGEGKGVRIRGRLATPMSHEFLQNCTQCHVPDGAPGPLAQLDDSVSTDNGFTGLPAPFDGPVAWAGAPPQIPHAVQMRENCASCHGVQARFGIRTTHPWRTNCTQCHVPTDPSVDQRPIWEELAPIGEPAR